MSEAWMPGDVPGGKQINPNGNEAKELAKWEQFHTGLVTAVFPPGNPYTYRPYPKMLFKAGKFQGKVVCGAVPPDASDYKDTREYQSNESQAKKFNESCQLIVNDDLEHSKQRENGWRDSPEEAVNHVLAVDKEVANITAARNWEDRNMGELAQREIQAKSDAVGGEHLPEIERTPIKRKGGWPKGKPRHSKTVA